MPSEDTSSGEYISAYILGFIWDASGMWHAGFSLVVYEIELLRSYPHLMLRKTVTESESCHY